MKNGNGGWDMGPPSPIIYLLLSGRAMLYLGANLSAEPDDHIVKHSCNVKDQPLKGTGVFMRPPIPPRSPLLPVAIHPWAKAIGRSGFPYPGITAQNYSNMLLFPW